MENTENNINKVTDTLKKELETLSDTGLHDLFMFYYRLNYQVRNIVLPDKFDEFLESFESNPFRLHEDKAFRKQLIENLIKYTRDHMSLITATMLLKRKFTVDEIIGNYYSSIHAFDNDLF